jgi:hypothetical protein
VSLSKYLELYVLLNKQGLPKGTAFHENSECNYLDEGMKFTFVVLNWFLTHACLDGDMNVISELISG